MVVVDLFYDSMLWPKWVGDMANFSMVCGVDKLYVICYVSGGWLICSMVV